MPWRPIHKNVPVRQRPKRSRKLLSMRPEKRPQTIMEQYRYREMMRQPHNQAVNENYRRLFSDCQTLFGKGH